MKDENTAQKNRIKRETTTTFLMPSPNTPPSHQSALYDDFGSSSSQKTRGRLSFVVASCTSEVRRRHKEELLLRFLFPSMFVALCTSSRVVVVVLSSRVVFWIQNSPVDFYHHRRVRMRTTHPYHRCLHASTTDQRRDDHVAHLFFVVASSFCRTHTRKRRISTFCLKSRRQSRLPLGKRKKMILERTNPPRRTRTRPTPSPTPKKHTTWDGARKKIRIQTARKRSF